MKTVPFTGMTAFSSSATFLAISPIFSVAWKALVPDGAEAEATAAFVKEGGALKDALARIEAERAMLASSLPADLLDAYKKTAARTGGVAVGRLQGSNCGVCRMAIEGGRLIDMKGQGNVAPCPQCGRLLILE